ncbi:MAG: CHASE2 domain-containing protein [Sphingopyxis sp.]|nr:CHASE2 domain-containing protein [Sphingopyxis sp.]
MAIALLLAVLLSAIDRDGVTERWLQDTRDLINSKPASGDIHIVEIDAKSLAKLNRWPWPRRHHAKLIDRLAAAGAEQIVFDVDFSSQSADAEDRALAAAIARAPGKVVLPTFRQPATNGDSAVEVENLPLAMLREHAFLGSVNVRADRGGQINNYPYGSITAATPRPSIGALLANTSGPVDQSFALDHSIDVATIPRHSFIDIVEGRFDPKAIKGKRMLVGATAIEIGDRYATARFSVVPGVVIQALAAETLLANAAIPDFGAWPLLIIAVAIVLFAPQLFGRREAAGGALILLTAIALFACATLGERLGIAHLDLAPAMLFLMSAAIAHHVVVVIQKLSTARNVDRELACPI